MREASNNNPNSTVAAQRYTSGVFAQLQIDHRLKHTVHASKRIQRNASNGQS